MIHIVWMILKIIGIIVAVLLGLALLAVGSILFVPVRYHIDGVLDPTTEKREFGIRFFWFFHLLSGYATYKESKFSWKIRFFGKKWSSIKESRQVPKKEKIKRAEKAERTKEKTSQKQEKKREKVTQKTDKQKEKKARTKKCTFQKMYDKIKASLKKKNELLDVLRDTKHRQAFGIVKYETLRLWRVIKPRGVVGRVHFGFEDPYITGNILAILSMLYPWYGDSLEIQPDFEHSVFDGDLKISGSIHLVWIGIIVWNLYRNDCVLDSYQDLKVFIQKA